MCSARGHVWTRAHLLLCCDQAHQPKRWRADRPSLTGSLGPPLRPCALRVLGCCGCEATVSRLTPYRGIEKDALKQAEGIETLTSCLTSFSDSRLGSCTTQCVVHVHLRGCRVAPVVLAPAPLHALKHVCCYLLSPWSSGICRQRCIRSLLLFLLRAPGRPCLFSWPQPRAALAAHFLRRHSKQRGASHDGAYETKFEQ